MISFLTYLAIALGVIALARLVRVYELSSVLKGTENDEPITESESRFNANLMLPFLFAFFGFFIYLVVSYKDNLLPEAASEHGKEIDTLWDFNMLIVTMVFALVNILLFYFAYKYYFRKSQKATFFAHSTKLEMIWTTIPALVLTVIIIYGLAVWNTITTPADPKKSVVIELFAEQFKWTARYGGADNTLGKTNYKLTADMNPLALDTTDAHSWDDKLVNGEFHLPQGKEILFKFRAKDVIHSAYMPHFRAQMNCVPGMETQFHFKPTISTAEMKIKTKNPEFDYVLMCNKICGATHYNMKMTIIVDTPEDYQKWLSKQKTFAQKSMSAKVPETKVALN
jgi:cytochrome c oxidase subunit 2